MSKSNIIYFYISKIGLRPILVASFFLSISVQAQTIDCKPGDSAVSELDTITKQIISKILVLTSLPLDFTVKECKIQNCQAFIDNLGTRYIAYNKKFVLDICDKDKNEWSLISILSHEVGHHLLGHTLKKRGGALLKDDELSADEFSGAMLARMGADLDQACQHLRGIKHPLCTEDDLEGYPCFEKRIEAVKKGFNNVPNNMRQNIILTKDLKKVDITSFKRIDSLARINQKRMAMDFLQRTNENFGLTENRMASNLKHSFNFYEQKLSPDLIIIDRKNFIAFDDRLEISFSLADDFDTAKYSPLLTDLSIIESKSNRKSKFRKTYYIRKSRNMFKIPITLKTETIYEISFGIINKNEYNNPIVKKPIIYYRRFIIKTGKYFDNELQIYSQVE